ncbi:MAG: ATP-dependent DNA helicase RecG [Dehalococcoidia bacterium]|nr:ATP-dependent DNA helicase RecG [Dehalococcoidia bacterium]
MESINSLRRVLELEHKKGYTDKAVLGGLDRYFHQQAKGIRQSINNQQLLAEFDELNLANSNYSSCNAAQRRKWIMCIFDWINELEKAKQDTFKSSLRSRTKTNVKAKTVKSYSQKKNDALDSPITTIKGIAPTTASKFARLNVKTVHDLLYFFPRRYIDYSQRKFISELEEGKEQTIIGIIWQVRIATFATRRGTEAIVGDETGNIRVVWFNQPYLAKKFFTNAKVAISGIVCSFKGRKVFESPEWEIFEEKELIHTGRLVPIYPLTQGLYPRQVRKWTKEVVDGWIWQVSDFLPSEIKTRCQLLDLPEAITQIHYPIDHSMAQRAKERLAFDELFLLQLGVLARKRDWQKNEPSNSLNIYQEVINTFLHCLPFTLTGAQERVLGEILNDLNQPRAMSRLLQGEVGSGKTIVATLALLIAAANNYQGVLMAPTEVLAEQHFNSICNYLSKASVQREEINNNTKRYTGFLSQPLTIALLIGSLTDRAKRDLHCKIKQGKIDIVIGTHSIIQKGVEFYKLGLAIIDEQQRFGVLQRQELRQKGFNPHILAMTATPIPRTMALTLYGDLDLSTIDELPPGRQEVKTRLLEPQYIKKAYNFLRSQINKGNQAFTICPLIEESDVLSAKAAITEYKHLSKEVFPDLKLGLLHGQMPSADKEMAIRRFQEGKLDILVSTSVVEVGIDIPNATVILVESADRFGLAQLHQLRGRVGRNKKQSYCILIPEKLSPEIRNRLQLMEKIHDGFALAQKDLELRGPGEFFGTHQSGLPDLKVAKLSNLHLLELARQEAINLFEKEKIWRQPEYHLLRQRLSTVWPKEVEWS